LYTLDTIQGLKTLSIICMTNSILTHRSTHKVNYGSQFIAN